ncbi:MAG: TlyA family RNA methyltransferase, partial [Lachnospiraceae bacterium]|nr:TlyA family RNA methyltransferase [Lachnospiraceae bacterium]
MSKLRLDQILVDRGFFDSREKAKVAIMEGLIFVDNQKEDKAGTQVKEDSVIEFRGEKMPYVSRGGYKLEKAIKVFDIDLKDKICMDIGSSTGGFTDCMLQNGAKYVFSIDCGTNQLAYKLRVNDKVKVLEKTNARYLEKEMFDDKIIDFSSIDVSF